MRAARGVVYAEVGEHRLLPQVFQAEVLLAAELAAQRGLPVGDVKLGRAARARDAGFGGLGGLDRLGFRSGLAQGRCRHLWGSAVRVVEGGADCRLPPAARREAIEHVKTVSWHYFWH